MVLRWRRAQGLELKDEATVMGNETRRSRYLSGSDLTVFLECHRVMTRFRWTTQ
jgi:hypothetical protein